MQFTKSYAADPYVTILKAVHAWGILLTLRRCRIVGIEKNAAPNWRWPSPTLWAADMLHGARNPAAAFEDLQRNSKHFKTLAWFASHRWPSANLHSAGHMVSRRAGTLHWSQPFYQQSRDTGTWSLLCKAWKSSLFGAQMSTCSWHGVNAFARSKQQSHHTTWAT